MNGFVELRKRKILHRDFKIENIFLNDNVLIIGDFGLAKMGAEMTTTKVGTPLTMAPELIFGNENSRYSSKADLWSIGCVYYQMLFGETPFFGLTISELKVDIKEKLRTGFKLKQKVSPESIDLIKKLLTFNPDKRIEWEGFFKHAVFSKFDKPKEPLAPNRVMTNVKKAPDTSRRVEEEFKQNKNTKVFKMDKFFELDDLLKGDIKIEAKEIEKKEMDEKIIKNVNKKIAIEEIENHYIHENNKILFFDFTIQKIKTLLDNPVYEQLLIPLIDISFLLNKKAETINSCIIK